MKEWASHLVNRCKCLNKGVYYYSLENIIMMVYEFAIAADYLPYIINGDATIFDYYGDDEMQDHLDWWIAQNNLELGVGHYSPVVECSDGELIDGFMTCDVTGAYCNCVLVEYVVM